MHESNWFTVLFSSTLTRDIMLLSPDGLWPQVLEGVSRLYDEALDPADLMPLEEYRRFVQPRHTDIGQIVYVSQLVEDKHLYFGRVGFESIV